MPLSTRVLDITTGGPAVAVPVRLDRHDGTTWHPLAEGETDADGRSGALPDAGAGTYRLRFGSGPYFADQGVTTPYPEVCVIFTVDRPEGHHHLPLLLGPFGYTVHWAPYDRQPHDR